MRSDVPQGSAFRRGVAIEDVDAAGPGGRLEVVQGLLELVVDVLGGYLCHHQPFLEHRLGALPNGIQGHEAEQSKARGQSCHHDCGHLALEGVAAWGALRLHRRPLPEGRVGTIAAMLSMVVNYVKYSI